MTSLLQGAVAGIIGGIVMAVFMMAMSKGQPGINAMFAARLTGRKPEESKGAGTGIHFLYSLLLGVIFAGGSNALSFDGLLGLGGLWINGILYGIVLFFVAGMALMPAAGVTKEMRRQMPKSQMAGMLVLHILFGLILAASIAFVPIT